MDVYARIALASICTFLQGFFLTTGHAPACQRRPVSGHGERNERLGASGGQR